MSHIYYRFTFCQIKRDALKKTTKTRLWAWMIQLRSQTSPKFHSRNPALSVRRLSNAVHCKRSLVASSHFCERVTRSVRQYVTDSGFWTSKFAFDEWTWLRAENSWHGAFKGDIKSRGRRERKGKKKEERRKKKKKKVPSLRDMSKHKVV